MTSTKRPIRAWPWWVALGVLVPLTTVLLIATAIANQGGVALAGQRTLVGHNAVITAPQTFESTHSVPWANARYTVTFPDDAPGALAGKVVDYQTPTKQLFSGDPFPDPADFRIVYTADGGYRLDGPKPAGSLSEITQATVDRDAPEANRAVARVAGVGIALVVLFVGLTTVAIVQTVRRSRSAPVVAAPTWVPGDEWGPPPPGAWRQ
jgi:hypothetical protein